MLSRELVVAALVTFTACGNVAAPRAVECGTMPVEVLPNGSFDSATPAWGQDPATQPLLCGQPTITPASQPNAACLGLIDGTIQTLTQSVPLPDGATNVTLSGQICIATQDTTTVEHDILQFDLLDSGNVIAALGKKTNLDGAANCQFGAFELTAPVSEAPENATLRLRAMLDPTLTTSYYLDNLSLKVGCTK